MGRARLSDEDRQKRSYAYRRANGLCVVCGTLAEPGGARCTPHREYMRDYQAAQYTPEKRRARSEALVDGGQCAACGSAWEECTCPDKMASRREALARKGLCVDCTSAAEVGKTKCRACLDRRAAVAKERADRLRALGLCTRCGSAPAVPGKTLCEPHLEDQREYGRRKQ